MASSSSNFERSYHVFMSFRGPDVRNTFLGHLYTALDQAGIYTYIDSEELRKGEQITPELMKAIEDSRIAVIIFSKDYTSSPWCLEELTKIMECRKQKGLIVLPVFYKVEPHEVRTPRESYRKAMAKHEVKFGKDSEKVKRWKKALFDASFLSGWHFTDGYEAGLIRQIVLEISTQLNRTPIDVPKYSVGIDSRVEELKTILNLRSKEHILMVGLWGQGGVGKTTLAKGIYNAVFREFEGSCFLERVRENFRVSNDLVPLQKKLLSEILPGKKLKVYSAGVGSSLIQERLCNKKVLIILDDVDDAHQLNALAGDCEWFGRGSRIIITTRNKHLLTSHGVDLNHIYEVKTLEDEEALELFRRHAFQRNQQVKIRSDLVDSVARYAKGLPLALEVLGSSLCGRAKEEWEETLKKLVERPNKKINGVLRISYDGLEEYEQEIFLDIACFFKGESTQYVKEVLNSCDFYATSGLPVLIERSLISEEANKTLQMHDLLQSMGMDIVKEEGRDNPGKRSRLWLQDDIRRVLSGDMGTDAVKAIVLKLPKPAEMYINHDAFANMRMLRLLILHNVDNPFIGPIHLPNELRWFEWPHCASIPEFSDGSKKLVGLDMRNSKIEARPKQFKGFENIKFINLSQCQSLVCMPDLSCTPNLEKLNLRGCQNLEHAHESIGYHRKLQLLDLKGCSRFRRFPDIRDKNKSLCEVILNGTSIEELPTSIENLISLKHLCLENCKKLAILPSSIYRLQNLSALMLGGCSKLIKFPKEEEDSGDPHTKIGFPKLRKLLLRKCNLSEVEFLENLSCFPLLQVLQLNGNNFANLPTCEQLHHLHVLDVQNCQQLQEIPKIPEKLKQLCAGHCKSLSRVHSSILYVNVVLLWSCQELFSNGLPVIDLVKPENLICKASLLPLLPRLLLSGGEMPKWLLPNKEGYISFVASKDLYKRFLGVAFCVVARPDEKRDFELVIAAYANGRQSWAHDVLIYSSNSDLVLLDYLKAKDLWREEDFGPNDLIHFLFHIRASRCPGRRGTMKKCGFRLICKPLDNDLEVLFQDDQLLDPALLYEVGYEDSQMSLGEESPREIEDLQDCHTSNKEDSSSELVHNFANFSIEKLRYSEIDPDHRNVYPGREMPKDFVLVEDDTISFMASQDLYDKLKGLSLCVAFDVEDGEKEVSFDIVPQVRGQRRNVLSGTLGSFDSDHAWIQFLEPNVLWGLLEGNVDFGQFEESYLRFSLTVRVSGGTMKKLGYLLKCKHLEDDLKVVLQENQLLDPASLHEDSDEPTDKEDSDGPSSEPIDKEERYDEQLVAKWRYALEPNDEEDSDEP